MTKILMLKVNDLQIKEFGMEIKSCYFCNPFNGSGKRKTMS